MVNASGKVKICVVTGTRADFGLLLSLLTKLRDHPSFDLSLLVTGTHLCHDYGLTYREVERAGFAIADQVEMLLASDTEVGIAKSVGLATIGFADSFRRLKPDLVLVTGDRFEMLAAAQAALFAKLPMAHIFGGDLTAGAFDEAIRHSITKNGAPSFCLQCAVGKGCPPTWRAARGHF